jgi:tRNA (guanine-N7-)-methyltransferase
MEVGFGKGLFLVTTAETRPDVHFVGVEIVRKYQLFTATRIAKRGLRNVRVACADARLFLRDYTASGSLDAMHVYYPDPWWKRRHEKRRLFTAEFTTQCARVLKPGGRLHLATDVEDYFQVMKALLAGEPALGELPPPPLNEPRHDLDYLTNFDRKFRQRGLPVFRAAYLRG